MAALGISIVFALFLTLEFFSIAAQPNGRSEGHDDAISQSPEQMLAEGKQTFRFDTFGDEVFWAIHSGSTKPLPSSRLDRFWHWA
jgi:hypothetical protein